MTMQPLEYETRQTAQSGWHLGKTWAVTLAVAGALALALSVWNRVVGDDGVGRGLVAIFRLAAACAGSVIALRVEAREPSWPVSLLVALHLLLLVATVVFPI